MRREPPPVKHHTRGRPSNLPPQLSKDLMFELPGTEGQKAGACISHDSLMSDLPWLHFPRSPLAIIHHAVTRGARGGGGEGALLTYLCWTAASWNKHRGQCIISWFLYAQNTSSALTSLQLIYLISTELIYCESPGLYHRYNQVHVYKISRKTQCLKWTYMDGEKKLQIVVMAEESSHWKRLFLKSYFAYFIMQYLGQLHWEHLNLDIILLCHQIVTINNK